MRRTPLYAAHCALDARMVDFAGWEMPVQYQGIIDEHIAVRTAAGLFDVSHMGEIEVRGAEALATCQYLTVNDVGRLRDRQAQYTMLCLPGGGVVDDVIVHRFAATRYLFCVNAGNREAVFAWMREHGRGATVIDRGDDFAQLALQGPRATAILGGLTTLPLGGVPPYCFVEGQVAGRAAIVAHTGYTGEDGWELYCAPRDAEPLWSALLQAGEPAGLVPAGLGARDTLRLEAGLALYGHELTRETTPLEAGLDRFVCLDKGEFIGRDALARQQRDGVPRCLVGISLLDPGIPRQGYPILRGGEVVGQVSSGTKSPTLGKAIGLGYVRPDCRTVGSKLAVEIRNRPVAAEVVAFPFYRRRREGQMVTTAERDC